MRCEGAPLQAERFVRDDTCESCLPLARETEVPPDQRRPLMDKWLGRATQYSQDIKEDTSPALSRGDAAGGARQRQSSAGGPRAPP